MQLSSLPPSSRSLPRWRDFFLRDKVSQMRENSSNWFSCQMHINLPLSQNIIITIIWIISTPPSARFLGSCSLGHLCDQSLTQPTWDVGPTAWKWDYDCFQLARSFVSVWAFFFVLLFLLLLNFSSRAARSSEPKINRVRYAKWDDELLLALRWVRPKWLWIFHHQHVCVCVFVCVFGVYYLEREEEEKQRQEIACSFGNWVRKCTMETESESLASFHWLEALGIVNGFGDFIGMFSPTIILYGAWFLIDIRYKFAQSILWSEQIINLGFFMFVYSTL